MLRTTISTPYRLFSLAAPIAGLVLSLAARAEDDLFEMSLGELLDIEVTSVSKKSQPVSQAAAAVFVITAEDIRRSGVTTIPEALRMAPGMEVAQVDANKWAISARGAQGRFSNKLLVLMDGRVLYSPLFSGVFWDIQDTLIQDVERIEVVRGPGATLWGANAVNGVINIITRSANDTVGGLFAAGGGDQERGYLGGRFGGTLGAAGHYRVYAKQFNRDGNLVAGENREAADDWDQRRLGFRADIQAAEGAQLTLQGDAYRGESGSQEAVLGIIQPFQQTRASTQDVSGFNLLTRWQDTVLEQDQISVQAFVDRARRDWEIADFDRTTIDVDVDYRTERFARHDLVFGTNYRVTRDRTTGSARVGIDPKNRDEELMSAFVQDDWALIPDQLSLIAGIKFEKNDYTGIEYQPNLRALWRPDARHSYWASVARAVRTPGRAERDSRVLVSVLPPTQDAGFPTAVFAIGNRNFDAEVLLAYEAGFKFEVNDSFAWDAALYYNDYEGIRATSVVGSRCLPAGALPNCLADPGTVALAIDTQQSNEGQVDAWGVEWAGTLQVASKWQLKGAYSYIDEKATATPGSTVAELDAREPRHSVSLRSAFQLGPAIDADLWLRYSDEIALARSVIDQYTNLDARVAWRPLPGAELSLTARNLFGSPRVEFESELNDLRPIEIQRSVHLQFSLEF